MDDRLQITFLGTGTSQGIPIIGNKHPVCLSDDPRDKRLRVSVLVQWKHYNYVIDCGPDFRQQLLTNPIEKLDGILFTHEHADHTAGLDDIRPFFFKQGDIPLFADERVIDSLHKRFYYFFLEERYPGVPKVDITPIEKNRRINLNGLDIEPIEVMHNKLPIFGFKIKDFVYLTDVKTINSDQLERIKNVKVLVVNALREKPHESHLNLEEALEMVALIRPKMTYFTHISHLLGFHEEVEANLPKAVRLAYDGLKISVG